MKDNQLKLLWKTHNNNNNNNKADWISSMAKELESWTESGNTHRFTEDDTKKISNWKTPGHDGIHGFRFKKFSTIDDSSTRNEQMSTRSPGTRMDDQRKDHIDWKDPRKGPAPKQLQIHDVPTYDAENTKAQIKEEIYFLQTNHGLFLKEQKGCHKGSRGTWELLYIDQYILNDSKTWRKNLFMAWIDYKKVYDMILPSWIINCLKMYKISDEAIKFIGKTTKTSRVELTAGGKRFEANIQRGIFQGDALSPLQFIIAMMPLNHILRIAQLDINLLNRRKR